MCSTERETGSALCKARLYQFPVHKGGFFAVGAKPNPWSLALWCACIDVPDIRRVGVSAKRTKDVCPALLLKTVYFLMLIGAVKGLTKSPHGDA